MDAVALMGKVVRQTADIDPMGCAKLVVFANAVEDNPFMAGAFHGVGEPECVINVGVSGPGVVAHALKSCKGEPFDGGGGDGEKDRLQDNPHGPAWWPRRPPAA